MFSCTQIYLHKQRENSTLDYFTFGKKDINNVVDNRMVDTTDAKKTDPAKGYNWNNPYPKLFFI